LLSRPTLRYLAVSGYKRAAIWDLEKNQRLTILRGVRDAFFTADGKIVFDFPKQDEVKRSIVAFTSQT